MEDYMDLGIVTRGAGAFLALALPILALKLLGHVELLGFYMFWLPPRERYALLRISNDPDDDGWYWMFGFWWFDIVRPVKH